MAWQSGRNLKAAGFLFTPLNIKSTTMNHKLNLKQAIQIRNDYRKLEGKTKKSGDMRLTVNKVVVVPYGPEFNDFIKVYYQNDFEYRNDEDVLAASFKPKQFGVFVLFAEMEATWMYANIFEYLEEQNIKIDLAKYGLKKTQSGKE